MFNVAEFSEQNPNIILQTLKKLRKDELIAIVQYFKQEIKPGLKKIRGETNCNGMFKGE